MMYNDYDLDVFQLKSAMEISMKEAGLQNITHTVTKVIQLFETKNSRHSTMIVGATLSGKTVSWKILQAAMSRLSRDGDINYQVVKVSSWLAAGLDAVEAFEVFLCDDSPLLINQIATWTRWLGMCLNNLHNWNNTCVTSL